MDLDNPYESERDDSKGRQFQISSPFGLSDKAKIRKERKPLEPLRPPIQKLILSNLIPIFFESFRSLAPMYYRNANCAVSVHLNESKVTPSPLLSINLTY